MKNPLPLLLLAVSALTPAIAADEPAKTRKTEKSELRTLTTTHESAPHVRIERRALGKEIEKETVAFLGVQTSPAPRTLAAQLNLPVGTGLVVNEVVVNSPAVGVLQEHDVLLKLDDQLLIETRQLAVLIRHRKEGDEVTLTYLRAGKQATAKVKLGKHEVPKFGAVLDVPTPGAPLHGFAFAPDQFRFVAPGAPMPPEDVNRMLSLIERGGDRAPVRIQIDRSHGPGLRATKVNTANSNLVFTDEAGSLELTIKDGKKSLVAKDSAGKELFSGAVDTDEQRRALPADVCDRLEKLEGMQNVTFRTDEPFQGGEARVMRPLGHGISVPPAPRPVPIRSRLPQYF